VVAMVVVARVVGMAAVEMVVVGSEVVA